MNTTTAPPPEAAPLADARRSLACCMTALRAAIHHRPDLGERLGMVHANLADQLRDLEVIR
jgi:hypothetical protein